MTAKYSNHNDDVTWLNSHHQYDDISGLFLVIQYEIQSRGPNSHRFYIHWFTSTDWPGASPACKPLVHPSLEVRGTLLSGLLRSAEAKDINPRCLTSEREKVTSGFTGGVEMMLLMSYKALEGPRKCWRYMALKTRFSVSLWNWKLLILIQNSVWAQQWLGMDVLCFCWVQNALQRDGEQSASTFNIA